MQRCCWLARCATSTCQLTSRRADCLLLAAATPLVSNLLEQHNDEEGDVIYLSRRRGKTNALSIFANAQSAIDFYSEPGNGVQLPLQFLLLEQKALCILHSSPRLLQKLARDIDARMFRFLAARIGQDSTAPMANPFLNPVPPAMLAMPSPHDPNHGVGA